MLARAMQPTDDMRPTIAVAIIALVVVTSQPAAANDGGPPFWFYRDANDDVQGPVDEARILSLVSEGKLRAGSRVARSRSGPWQSLQVGWGRQQPSVPTPTSPGSATETDEKQSSRDPLEQVGLALIIGGATLGATTAIIGTVAFIRSKICIMSCPRERSSSGLVLIGAGLGTVVISVVAGAILVRAGQRRPARTAALPVVTAGVDHAGGAVSATWRF